MISSRFRFLSQLLNLVTAFPLSPVPPVAPNQLSEPNRCFSHGSSSCHGSRYSISLEHFLANLSRREGYELVLFEYEEDAELPAYEDEAQLVHRDIPAYGVLAGLRFLFEL